MELASTWEVFLTEHCSTHRPRVRKVCLPLESPVKAASARPVGIGLLLHMALSSLTKVTQTIVQITTWATKKTAESTRVIDSTLHRLLV